jgi:hypothetical protein
MSLLPENFDELIDLAVKHFWKSRTTNVSITQEGSRSAVIGGKNMDGFSAIIKTVAMHCGLTEDCINISVKKQLTLPGYFRPTKMWDAVVMYKGALLAAFELKSQVGSFGNNFNNRTEESLGSALDFWTAHRESAFHNNNSTKINPPNSTSIQIQPFLGYLMLLEDTEASATPVKVEESHYKVFPEFANTSYANRYRILCEKLVQEKLYSSSALVLSKKVDGTNTGHYTSPTDSLTPKSLFAKFAGMALATIETYK